MLEQSFGKDFLDKNYNLIISKFMEQQIMLVWLNGKARPWESAALVKQKLHFLTTKFHRKNHSKTALCWCGSAVEHHLGKTKTALFNH